MARYTFGGDEFLFVEISEEMSLEAFFKAMAIVRRLQQSKIEGVIEVCLANASYQVNFNPDTIPPAKLEVLLRSYEQEMSNQQAPAVLKTRVIELPAFFNDPWTNETGAKFRDRHQDPSCSDIEYAARINGYTVEEFIDAYSGSPWFVSMVGFVAGLPFMYQMVERSKQIEVPKYLRPRLDTPKQTIGHGGCFCAVYSVRGAGGYQMFGITPTPIFDPQQKLPYFKQHMILFRPGDIVKFKSIDRATYDDILQQVEAGTFDVKIREVEFDIRQYEQNPVAYNHKLLEVLA